MDISYQIQEAVIHFGSVISGWIGCFIATVVVMSVFDLGQTLFFPIHIMVVGAAMLGVGGALWIKRKEQEAANGP